MPAHSPAAAKSESGWVALVVGGEMRPFAVAENRALVEALAREGLEARLVEWDAPSLDLAGAAACILRTPWDYSWKADRFLAWIDSVATRLPVANPPSVVRWNADKRYLAELELAGVRIPPTLFVSPDDELDLAWEARARRWERVVVKPAVDAGATRAHLVLGNDADGLASALAKARERGVVLVQPFLRSIAETGETSLVYFGGEFSHAVRKLPARGDWRVQIQWGGEARPHDASEEERAFASRVLAAAPGPLLYARVDVVRLDDGTPALIELEAIEPFLFLATAPGSAERYARTIVRYIPA